MTDEDAYTIARYMIQSCEAKSAKEMAHALACARSIALRYATPNRQQPTKTVQTPTLKLVK